MKFLYSAEHDCAVMNTEQLSCFARTKTRRIIPEEISVLPRDGRFGVPLSSRTECDGVSVEVSDVCDVVYSGAIQLIREKRRNRSSISPAQIAQMCIFGHLYCESTGENSVRMIITFTSPDKENESLYFDADGDFLRLAFNSLISRAIPFCRVICEHGRGLSDFAAAPFPYHSIREGQRDFINDAYRAIKQGKRLVVSAPTGIGKTVSALYPAVRSVGSGLCDKIFCLCAKNETGKAFFDASRNLSRYIPQLRAIFITSKERVCPYRGLGYSSRRCRLGCNLVSTMGTSYEVRRDEALLALLSEHRVFSTELIEKFAAEHTVCPYELSLDLSEYCDIVVCDYNYVFDFSIRFKRYFNEVHENYVFLIDEAHNLPKRGRDTYSAVISDSICQTLRESISEGVKMCKENTGENADIKLCAEVESKINGLSEVFGKILNYTALEAELEGDEVHGFYKSSSVPTELSMSLGELSFALSKLITELGMIPRSLERADSLIRKFISVCDLFDEHYTFFAENTGKQLNISLVCLDPSYLLDRAMSCARSTVIFSATLSPEDYFADVCGCADAHILSLDSPFDPENLCLVCVDSVKTTLAERRKSAAEVAELITAVIEAKRGNYLVYFPSYDYLKRVYKLFIHMAEDVNAICQTSGMDRNERKVFLSNFEHENPMTTVGFCVLGGMFSEGIDLAGDALIGAVIVGNGMGSITSEQNILREYYDSTRENGMEYAYIYPGFNNVMQAAGRVIRSENDRGVVVLIDERYSDPNIQRLFPKYWNHMKFTSDSYTLSELCERFWANSEDSDE